MLRYLPRFREASRALRTLEAREGWSRAEIEAFQLERLNAVWGHAVADVPHYRDLAGKGKLPATFASLAEFRQVVPVLDKAVVQADPRRFLSERAGRGRWVCTGGSTGTPLSA